MEQNVKENKQEFIVTLKPFGDKWKLYANSNLIGKYSTKSEALNMIKTIKTSLPECVVNTVQR